MFPGLAVASSLRGTWAPPGACAVEDPQPDPPAFYNSNCFMGLLSSISFSDKVSELSAVGTASSLTYSMVEELRLRDVQSLGHNHTAT